MNTVDKITRDSKILLDSAKDTTANNLISAFRSKEVNLSEDQLSKIVTIINSSIDQGYQKALSNFQSSIKKHIDA